MMPDLGSYAAEVLLAYGVTAALLGGLVALSLVQARRARARLGEAERRRGAALTRLRAARGPAPPPPRR